MAERRLSGRAASPGLAEGVLARPEAAAPQRTPLSSTEDEADALMDAVEQARRDVAALAASAEGEAAEILGFQVAMLEDAALVEHPLELIAAGTPADAAWDAGMAQEIAHYTASDDEYFRARSADLADIRARVLALLVGGGESSLPPGAVLLADDLVPSRFLAIDWSRGGGIALSQGSPSSHVAMLARARGVPMVVGLGPAADDLADGTVVLVDGTGGALLVDPAPETEAALRRAARVQDARRAAAEVFRFAPAATGDGTEIRVLVNVGDPAELDGLDPAMCDGVGLVRTEFLFHAGQNLPDEEAQFAAYAAIVRWAAGRPVTLRTLDAGGDKPIAGLTIEGESNPFLGVRGIRLSLARPEIFRVQLRAMVRAAALGDVRIMLPMVAVPAELDAARTLLDEAAEQCRLPAPPLGIMVEVPAAALCAERFAADFYSIGSNDLVQYTLAAARDISGVAALADPADPAVLELIRRTVAAGAARGVEVSLCGDAAGQPAMTAHLLQAGLRSLSMAPAAVAEVKQAIAAISLNRERTGETS